MVERVKWWRVLVVAVLLVAGCGEEQRPKPVPTPTRFDTIDRLPAKTGGFEALVARREAYEQARRDEIARMRRSKTVEGALRVARLTGRITPGRGELDAPGVGGRQRRRCRKLSGVRATELGYVVGAVRNLAAARMLTADRLRPTFLILRQNVRFWKAQPVPASGFRTTFGRDPVIFQYYPGRGLQVQPLASWGRANAIAGACLAAMRSRTTKDTCRKAILTRSLDRLASLGARRSGYLAWEYYFAYGTGAPPWVSGMTQATATQALARGYRALGHKRWKRAAERALGAFEQAPPSGVRVSAPGGSHYLLYSFSPSHRVFNGGLQAVLGLRDTGALLHSGRATQALPRRRPRGAARGRRVRHRRLVAVLRERRGVHAQLPRADRGLPRRALRSHRRAGPTAARAGTSRATSASPRGSGWSGSRARAGTARARCASRSQRSRA